MASLLGRLLEGLYKGIEDARDDIRHKVVEEGWFGKQVTDTSVPLHTNDQRPSTSEVEIAPTQKIAPPLEVRRQSFDELWATEDRAKGVAPPEKDRGIDI